MTISSSQTPPTGATSAELARMLTTSRELVDRLVAAHSSEELMDTVAAIEVLRSNLDALELVTVRELDVRGAVKGAGWASTQDYVTTTAGGHKGLGAATVRLAKACAEPLFTPVAAALRDGCLSTAKAHVIERAVDALPRDPGLRTRAVTVLLDEAKRLDATELRKVVRRLLSIVDPDGDERRDEKALDRLERAAHVHRHLTITADQAGGAWIRGRCSSEDAALIKSTLIPLAAPVPSAGPVCDADSCAIPGCRHDGRDPRDHGARMLDALAEACRRLQTVGVLPESHGATPRLTLTIDYLQLQKLSGLATTETGEQLTASALRRLCCDAEVIPAVLGTGSAVLDVGRTRRLVTAVIWKALVARDAHCRFPHCRRPPLMCHAHHVEHWIDGGPTSLDNLLLLCGHHHRLVHACPWQISRDGPATFTFHPPSRTSAATGRLRR